MKTKNVFLAVIVLFLAASGLQAQETSQPPVDSVFIFKSKNGNVEKFEKGTREIGKHIKHLQITNFVGKGVEISLSLDLKQWSNFTLKSPEKKVFVCDGINMMYLIISPKSERPIRKKIYRDKKYELFINSMNMVDIKEIVKKK